MKVLAFGASNSKNSINKKLANYAARQLANTKVNLIDLNDFEMPLYGIDREKESGIPQEAHDFKKEIAAADVLVISFAEHNGAYTTAFKNIFDWVSRIESDIWMNKPMWLLATSPGARGGASVLEIAEGKIQRMNSTEITTFSLPSFFNNFDEEKGIVDSKLAETFKKKLHTFEEIIKTSFV